MISVSKHQDLAGSPGDEVLFVRSVMSRNLLRTAHPVRGRHSHTKVSGVIVGNFENRVSLLSAVSRRREATAGNTAAFAGYQKIEEFCFVGVVFTPRKYQNQLTDIYFRS